MRARNFWVKEASRLARDMPLIEAQHVWFNYHDQWRLEDVELEACPGEIVALFGPNGSGKTTLLRLLAGLLQPQEGSIRLLGAPLASYPRRRLAQLVAFLPQTRPPLRYITVGELVARGRSPHQRSGWVLAPHDLDKVRWALGYLRLENLEHRDISSLSGGEQQRAWIAMVLAQDTQILLLDEPVTFLDIKHQWDLLGLLSDLVSEYGKTVITVFQDVNHVMAVADRAYLLNSGRVIASGIPEEVITPSTLAEVYGIQVHICKCQACGRSVVIPEGAFHHEHAFYQQIRKEEAK